jgi:hypothetical protein
MVRRAIGNIFKWVVHKLKKDKLDDIAAVDAAEAMVMVPTAHAHVHHHIFSMGHSSEIDTVSTMAWLVSYIPITSPIEMSSFA